MVWEILLAGFAVIGVAACLRFLAGALLYPVKSALIFIPARGNGRDLEHQVKGTIALSSGGRLEGETIYLADMGLNAEGLAAAEKLCLRYPNLRYCVLDEEETIS